MKAVIETHQTALCVAEQRKLEQCEEEIQQGGDMIINALKVIHDEKLYRGEFKTFGEYVKERVGKSRQWAYQQLAHVEVIANIASQSEEMSTIVDKMPEGATRELKGLDAETQTEVVKKASDNGSKVPKAKDIKEAKGDVERAKETGKVSGGTTFDVDEIEAAQASILKDFNGVPIPEHLKEAHGQVMQIKSRCKEIDKFKRDLLEFSESPGCEFVNPQVIEHAIRDIKNQFHQARFYCVCPECKGSSCNRCKGLGYFPDGRKNHLQTEVAK